MMEPLLEGLEKTSYREGDTRVKVFGHGYLKSDILNEALNQARVEKPVCGSRSCWKCGKQTASGRS